MSKSFCLAKRRSCRSRARTWREAHPECGMQRNWHAADLVHVSTWRAKTSNSDLLCIVNADMILMPDFVEAAKQAHEVKRHNLSCSVSAGITISQLRSTSPKAGKSSLRYICPQSEPASSSRGKRFLPLPKILLHRHPQFHHRPRRLGQLDDLQSPQGRLAGD